jgi:hypothetical protein
VLVALETMFIRLSASMFEPIELDLGESQHVPPRCRLRRARLRLVEMPPSLLIAVDELPVLGRHVSGPRFGGELKQRDIAERVGLPDAVVQDRAAGQRSASRQPRAATG